MSLAKLDLKSPLKVSLPEKQCWAGLCISNISNLIIKQPASQSISQPCHHTW